MRYLAALCVTCMCALAAHQFLLPKILPVPPLIGWIIEAETRKFSNARKVEAPRILIVGGSEAHYGLSAEILEAQTGLPAFNLATHAGLTWRTLALRTQSLIRPGDVIIFSLNHDRLVNADPTDVEVAYWRRRGPLQFVKFPVEHWPQYWSGDVLRDLVLSPTRRTQTNWRASVDRLTERGDETNNQIPLDQKDAFSERLMNAHLSPPFRGEMIGLKGLMRFKDMAESKGAHFFVYFPAQLERDVYLRSALYRDDAEQIARLLESHAIASLNNKDESYLPVELMFDTIYHPSDEGRRIISGSVASALAARLRDPAQQ